MIRTSILIVVCLAVLSPVVLAEEGVYVISRKDNTSQSTRTMVTSNHRLYVAMGPVAFRTNSVRQAITAVRARYNNIYACAINTQGIRRATVAVRDHGRVYLRAGTASRTRQVDLAANDR
jgi:hypothetical protein